MSKETSLICLAVQLYDKGVEVEKAREELRQLVEAGMSYESPEMLAALQAFQEKRTQWESMEKEYKQQKAILMQ